MDKIIEKELSYKISHRAEGFTIVEMLVAIGVFMILISMALGIFVQGIKSHRVLVNLMAVSNNAAMVLEQIARDARTGHGFTGAAGGDCPTGFFGELSFVNHRENDVRLGINAQNKSIDRTERDDEIVFFDGPITSGNVLVEYLCFAVKQDIPDQDPWRVTAIMGVTSPALGAIIIPIQVQTTVSARTLPRDL